MMAADHFDCIVVGAGPAGLTAAIYLTRFHRRVLVIENRKSRVSPVPNIRNLIGYSNGISGRSLLQRLRRQAVKYGTQFIAGDATPKRTRQGFRVVLGQKEYTARSLILAIGVRDVQPEGVDWRYLCQKGVLAYCPVCDGYDHSGQEIGLLINSVSGLKKIDFLRTFTERLHVVIIRAMKLPSKEVARLKRLGIKLHVGELENLSYRSLGRKLTVQLKGETPFSLKMAYVELGAEVPEGPLLHLRDLERTREGRIVTSCYQETSLEDVYAVGDCTDSLAQISVATGEAAIAATHLHNRLITSDP